MTPQTILYDCNHCGGQMTYAAEHRGMASQCPHCQQQVVLGGSDPVPQQAPKKKSYWTKDWGRSPALEFADSLSKKSKNPKLMRMVWFSCFLALFIGGQGFLRYSKGSRQRQQRWEKEAKERSAGFDRYKSRWDAEDSVRAAIQRQLQENPETRETTIKLFYLAFGDDGNYEGTLTLDTHGKIETVAVEVTRQGSQFVWEIIPSTNSTSAKQTPTPNPIPVQKTWNTRELDAVKNGNIPLAVREISTKSATKSTAITPEPEAVAKAPWKYYGKVVKITGIVEVVQDYPPNSDFAKMLNSAESAEIVIICDDETYVSMFCMKSSGSIRVGETVNLYGYAVGLFETPNKIGGTFTHLILVGNAFDSPRQQ